MEHKFTIDKRFTTRVERCDRVLEVAEAFGIGLEDREFVVFDNLELTVRDGDVVYITGQSGGGKSVLLRELSTLMAGVGRTVVNLDHVELRDKPLIAQIGTDVNEAIRLLAIAGINDAYLYVRKPGELSDGQRYRFRLAKAIETGAQVWVADEFLAVLDRDSAKVIAYSIQKAARRAGASVIVATTHTDMVDDLRPDLRVEKRYREKLRVDRWDRDAERAEAQLGDGMCPRAVAMLSSALREDSELAWTWHCNLAMLAVDAGAPHAEANHHAASFMLSTFGVDTRANPHWDLPK